MRAIVREAIDAGARRLRHLEVADARRLRAASRCRAAPPSSAEIASPRRARSARRGAASCRRRSARAFSSTSSRQIARETGRTGDLDGAARRAARTGIASRLPRAVDARCSAGGTQVVPQVTCRPLIFEFQFKEPFIFESMPVLPAGLGRRLRGQDAHLRATRSSARAFKGASAGASGPSARAGRAP